jgi:hypothetical protein
MRPEAFSGFRANPNSRTSLLWSPRLLTEPYLDLVYERKLCTTLLTRGTNRDRVKDVPKTLVYELARYKNKKEGKTIIPKNVMVKAPSAELRPNQKDEDSLPP